LTALNVLAGYNICCFVKVLDTDLLFHKMAAVRNLGFSDIKNVNTS